MLTTTRFAILKLKFNGFSTVAVKSQTKRVSPLTVRRGSAERYGLRLSQRFTSAARSAIASPRGQDRAGDPAWHPRRLPGRPGALIGLSRSIHSAVIVPAVEIRVAKL